MEEKRETKERWKGNKKIIESEHYEMAKKQVECENVCFIMECLA